MLMLCATGILHAQQTWHPAREIGVKVSYASVAEDGSGNLVNGKFDYNAYLGQCFSIGGGVGANVLWSGDEDGVLLGIPVTLNLACHIPAQKCSPYIAMQGGPIVAVAIVNSETATTVTGYLNPHFGVKIPIGNRKAVDLALGYVRYGVDQGGINAVELKAGLCFGFGGSTASSTARRDQPSQLTVRRTRRTTSRNEKMRDGSPGRSSMGTTFKSGGELELYTACKESGYNRMGGMYGVRGYALWSVLTPNLYAGIAASIGIASHDEYDWQGNYHQHSTPIRFAIMPRVRYDITEATFAKRVNPFAQVDVGYAYNGVNSQVAVEPAVGISVKMSGGHSFDFSAGYLPKVYFNRGNKSDSGCFRLAAGYTF